MKLYNDDCLTVLRSLGDESVDAIFCDPPYGMSYNSHVFGKIANDKQPYIWWLWDAFRVLKDTGTIFCFCRWKEQADFKRALELAGFKVQSLIVWDKRNHGAGDTKRQFAPRHELIFFASKSSKFSFPGARPTDVIQVPLVPSAHRTHPTEKPVELITHLLRHVLPKQGTPVVLDPCMGTGSTGVGALELGADFIGIEMDLCYFKTAKAKLEKVEEGCNATT